jgi:hypothetical protein
MARLIFATTRGSAQRATRSHQLQRAAAAALSLGSFEP